MPPGKKFHKIELSCTELNVGLDCLEAQRSFRCVVGCVWEDREFSTDTLYSWCTILQPSPCEAGLGRYIRGYPRLSQACDCVFQTWKYDEILGSFLDLLLTLCPPTAWKLTFKLTYHTFSDMFGDILKKLDRSRDLILQSANVAHFQKSQEARILFTKEMELLLDEKQNQRRIAITDWLSSEPSSAIQQQELRKIRAMLPQTTRWIFSRPQMSDWLKRTDYTPCTFWLCGIPGAGMSFNNWPLSFLRTALG